MTEFVIAQSGEKAQRDDGVAIRQHRKIVVSWLHVRTCVCKRRQRRVYCFGCHSLNVANFHMDEKP